jgi:hypothetical protein
MEGEARGEAGRIWDLLGLKQRWLCGSRDLGSSGELQVGPEARRNLATRFISLGCTVGTM